MCTAKIEILRQLGRSRRGHSMCLRPSLSCRSIPRPAIRRARSSSATSTTATVYSQYFWTALRSMTFGAPVRSGSTFRRSRRRAQISSFVRAPRRPVCTSRFTMCHSDDCVERERRLGIHVVSDEIERWITGTRGISASRIAFVEGPHLKIVDSDGANERTIPTAGAALSPSWHPSGRYIVYVDADDRGTRIAQIDLRTMRPRLLSASNRGLNITPVYTKDGKSIVWASGGDSPAELVLASANGEDS